MLIFHKLNHIFYSTTKNERFSGLAYSLTYTSGLINVTIGLVGL